MENQFTVLMFGNQFVDESRLREGIYPTTIPTLHRASYTLKDFIGANKYVMDILNYDQELKDKVLASISQCEMVLVTLSIL